MHIYQNVKKYMNLSDYIKKYNFKNIKVTDDTDAWIQNPDYNFIYNKLWIAQSQGISCGPMNVYPNKYYNHQKIMFLNVILFYQNNLFSKLYVHLYRLTITLDIYNLNFFP